MEYLDNLGKSQGYIGLLAEKSGLRHAYVVIIIALLSAFLLLNALLNGLILFLVAIIGPAYVTYKAIESPNKEDDTKMLYYWTVLGFFMIADRFFGFLLDFLPFSGVFRFIFLVCLIIKDFALSKTIYQMTIAPILNKYKVYVDEATKAAKDSVKSAATEAAKEASKVKDKLIEEGIKKATSG
jgi:receptor expression-enhancing protein 5/6